MLESFAIGGGERIALEVASMQAERDHDVWAISLTAGDGPLGSEFRRRHVETVEMPKHDGLDATLVPRLALWLARHRIDVVHTHHPLALIYAAPAARLVGVSVVYTMHGAAPDTPRRMLLRRMASRLVDSFVVVSPALAAAARGAEGANPDKIEVIPNGVDTDLFREDPEDRLRARAALGVGEHDWVVGTAGRLAPEKDQASLLHAMAPLIRRGASLIVAGEGPERASLERLADDLGIRDRIKLVGAIADVPHFLHALDVFVLSSRLEGLPLALLEAMATGLPVVSTSVGGVASAVAHEDTGLLVPPGDQEALSRALDSVHTEPAKARGMGRRARQSVVQRFSSRRMQEDYANLYSRLFGASQ